jgi:hypothetical protein
MENTEYKEAGSRGKYYLYRKIENGKGKWLAEDCETGEIFPITYKQAIGEEPIRPTTIGNLSRKIGEKLLPKIGENYHD